TLVKRILAKVRQNEHAPAMQWPCPFIPENGRWQVVVVFFAVFEDRLSNPPKIFLRSCAALHPLIGHPADDDEEGNKTRRDQHARQAPPPTFIGFCRNNRRKLRGQFFSTMRTSFRLASRRGFSCS